MWRDLSGNAVTVESDVPVSTTIHVAVDQSTNELYDLIGWLWLAREEVKVN